MFDSVRVSDSGRIFLNRKEVLRWGDEKSVVETEGWVKWISRERGKLIRGKSGEGHNIYTNTGREFLSMLMTYRPNNAGAYRQDRVSYIGIGTGLQIEDANVSALVSPLAYVPGTFLAALDHTSTDFPLSPARTTVRYSRIFTEDQLTYEGNDSVLISELGLFTDGNPNNAFQAGPPPAGRPIDILNAKLQSPIAYKALPEPVEKTSVIEFEVAWEIRF